MSDSAGAYGTVVVGTDGSESSLRAVSRAGVVTGATGSDDRGLSRAQDVPRDEAGQVAGSHPVEDAVRTAAVRTAAVRTAAERAGAAGAADVGTVAVQGPRRSTYDVLVVHTTG